MNLVQPLFRASGCRCPSSGTAVYSTIGCVGTLPLVSGPGATAEAAGGRTIAAVFHLEG